MREPNGRLQDVAPTHGFASVPLPLNPAPPVQVGAVEKPGRNGPTARRSWLKTFPDDTSPPADFTTSFRPLNVNVSNASSTLLRIEYEHE